LLLKILEGLRMRGRGILESYGSGSLGEFEFGFFGGVGGEVGVAVVELAADPRGVLDAMVAPVTAVVGSGSDLFEVPTAVGAGLFVGVPGEAGVSAGLRSPES
jgi:hypothetical protein